MRDNGQVKKWYFDNVAGADEKGYNKLRAAFRHARRTNQSARTLALPMDSDDRFYNVRFSFNKYTRDDKRNGISIEVLGPYESPKYTGPKYKGV